MIMSHKLGFQMSRLVNCGDCDDGFDSTVPKEKALCDGWFHVTKWSSKRDREENRPMN